MIVDSQVEPMEEPAASPSRRRLIARGVTWTALGQVIDTVLSFAAMLLLVRIIAPAEYGRAAAAIGVIALFNTFGSHMFVGHAIQLPDDQEPDWQAHWSAAIYIQFTLAAACFATGSGCRYVPQFRPVAPLLQVASVGLLLDGPNQIGIAMLQRDLELRTLRLLANAATALKLLATVSVALAGGGAYAIVLGGNVVITLPFAIHLLVVHRWRPPLGWLRLPRRSEYRAPMRFGFQQIGSALVSAVCSTSEAAVLPAAIGFEGMGLLNRARALFTSTGGRINSVVVDAVYPFLPRAAANRETYARHATMFLQAVLFITIPAGMYLGLEGPAVSRLLYGTKWIAMDPLIWPGALSGIALAVSVATASVLIAAGRLRTSLVLEATMTVVSLAALAVAWSGAGVFAYAWSLTAAELLAAGIALRAASSVLSAGWMRRALYPPTAAAVCAAAVALATRALGPRLTPVAEVLLTGSVFILVAVAVCRLLFSEVFGSLIRLIAGRRELPPWLVGGGEACA